MEPHFVISSRPPFEATEMVGSVPRQTCTKKSALPRAKRWRVWGALCAATVIMFFINILFAHERMLPSNPTRAKIKADNMRRSEAMINAIALGNDFESLPNSSSDHPNSTTGIKAPDDSSAPPATNSLLQAEAANMTQETGHLDECFLSLDYGLVEKVNFTQASFCSDDNSSSKYTFYDDPDAEFNAAKFENFVFDLRSAQISQDISTLAQDGGAHDPRFKYVPNFTLCDCKVSQDTAHGAPDIWRHRFALADKIDRSAPVCQLPPSKLPDDVLTLDRAVVMVRKDDHNPFFQISGILNAWIMLKGVGWDSKTTQLVTLDRALPSPVDELRHAMLGPNRPVIGGEVLQKNVVHFDSMLVAPYEFRGPLMSRLNDDQPCFHNAMIMDFRNQALESMNTSPHKTNPRRCLVTVISRRPYDGRRVQRVWRNEDDILARLREDYKNAYQFGECEFQSLDFVNLTMHDQMRVMVDSDVVIGMHGAGMVNVMWTRPGTLVVEIFPRMRRRWGYRNICQFLGCSWHDFREGRDLFVRTTDPNDLDKSVLYDEFKAFFDPLFRSAITKLEQEVG